MSCRVARELAPSIPTLSLGGPVVPAVWCITILWGVVSLHPHRHSSADVASGRPTVIQGQGLTDHIHLCDELYNLKMECLEVTVLAVRQRLGTLTFSTTLRETLHAFRWLRVVENGKSVYPAVLTSLDVSPAANTSQPDATIPASLRGAGRIAVLLH
jgi:hypothetical protein